MLSGVFYLYTIWGYPSEENGFSFSLKAWNALKSEYLSSCSLQPPSTQLPKPQLKVSRKMPSSRCQSCNLSPLDFYLLPESNTAILRFICLVMWVEIFPTNPWYRVFLFCGRKYSFPSLHVIRPHFVVQTIFLHFRSILLLFCFCIFPSLVILTLFFPTDWEERVARADTLLSYYLGSISEEVFQMLQ